MLRSCAIASVRDSGCICVLEHQETVDSKPRYLGYRDSMTVVETENKTSLLGAWVCRDVYDLLGEVAWRNRRSVSAELRIAIERHLAQTEKEPAVTA